MSKQLYAVRTIDTKRPVGFFYVDSLDKLYWFADEATDERCEFQPVKEFGLMWTDAANWKMAEDNADETPETGPEGYTAGTELTEKTCQYVGGYDGGKGKPWVALTETTKTNGKASDHYRRYAL